MEKCALLKSCGGPVGTLALLPRAVRGESIVADSKHWAPPTWLRSLATPCWLPVQSYDFSSLQAFIVLRPRSVSSVDANPRSLGPVTIKKTRSRGWNLGILCLGGSS